MPRLLCWKQLDHPRLGVRNGDVIESDRDVIKFYEQPCRYTREDTDLVLEIL